MAVQKNIDTYITDQRDVFDKIMNDDFKAYFDPRWDIIRNFEVKKLFDYIQPKTILNIGCGIGYHDQKMANYPFVETVTAIDYSPKSIEKANECYPHHNVLRSVDDFNSLQTDKKFELLVSFQVFEHLDDTKSYFDFCHNFCEDDGHIAIFTPHYLRFENRLRRLFGRPKTFCDPLHFDEYTPQTLRQKCEEENFEYVTHFRYGFDMPPRLRPLLKIIPYRFLVYLGYIISPWASGLCVIAKKTNKL